jgi:hypothetical protein
MIESRNHLCQRENCDHFAIAKPVELVRGKEKSAPSRHVKIPESIPFQETILSPNRCSSMQNREIYGTIVKVVLHP